MAAVQVLRPSDVTPPIFQVALETQHTGIDPMVVSLLRNVNGEPPGADGLVPNPRVQVCPAPARAMLVEQSEGPPVPRGIKFANNSGKAGSLGKSMKL